MDTKYCTLVDVFMIGIYKHLQSWVFSSVVKNQRNVALSQTREDPKISSHKVKWDYWNLQVSHSVCVYFTKMPLYSLTFGLVWKWCTIQNLTWHCNVSHQLSSENVFSMTKGISFFYLTRVYEVFKYLWSWHANNHIHTALAFGEAFKWVCYSTKLSMMAQY